MDKFLKSIFSCSLVLSFFFRINIDAQPVQTQNSSEIRLALEKLNVLGSVLYIAAHPDDENTGLMAFLSKGRKFRTAYLSLTRGDGGQNLIGSEKGSEIGIIRTQELLQARSLDGAEQYFTRAVDFGFSKSPEESFNFWEKEKILSDIVWVIRNYKPDVIITRFPPAGNGGHGHHTASASLALEAFTAAADTQRFTEQLKYVQPWKSKRIFWNSWRPGQNEIDQLLKVDTGQFNFLLGKSYTEIAAESRSMHKSQGFGVTASRTPRIEYFQFIEGDAAKTNLFEEVNTTWDRIKHGEKIGKQINEILQLFDFHDPSKSLPKLIELYAVIDKIENNYWVDIKRKELLSIIQSCAGLWMESLSSDYSAAPGDEVNVKTMLVNRSENIFKIKKIEFPSIPSDTVMNNKLEQDQLFTIESKIKIPDSYPISQPYWLVKEPTKGSFTILDQQKIGKAENDFSIPVNIYVSYGSVDLVFSIPLRYRWNDRVDGEHYRPFEVCPPVIANLNGKVAIFPDEKTKNIRIKLKSFSPNISGEVHLQTDGNWKDSPYSIPFSLKNKYDEQTYSFKITPPKNSGVSMLNVELNIDGKTYNKSFVEILHAHIKPQVYFPESKISLVKLDIKKFDDKIGYIMGSGDDVPECLQNIGYDVTLLSDEMIEETDLSQYHAIIAGIRAYNTRERLKFDQTKLMEFVKNGGTFIVQYNVQSGLQTENIGPYPFKLGSGRITVEEAPLNFVNPEHQLLNFPNQITSTDFENWVQERGLYFADRWDEKYETIFSGHDPGEKDLTGGTLFTHYGKGIFIFSGLAWFRQLPAGVPGAYRLFVNMISAGKYDGK